MRDHHVESTQTVSTTPRSCARAAARIYVVGFDRYCDEVRATSAEAARRQKIYAEHERRLELRRRQREAEQPGSGFSVGTLVAGIVIGMVIFSRCPERERRWPYIRSLSPLPVAATARRSALRQIEASRQHRCGELGIAYIHDSVDRALRQFVNQRKNLALQR